MISEIFLEESYITPDGLVNQIKMQNSPFRKENLVSQLLWLSFSFRFDTSPSIFDKLPDKKKAGKWLTWCIFSKRLDSNEISSRRDSINQIHFTERTGRFISQTDGHLVCAFQQFNKQNSSKEKLKDSVTLFIGLHDTYEHTFHSSWHNTKETFSVLIN